MLESRGKATPRVGALLPFLLPLALAACGSGGGASSTTSETKANAGSNSELSRSERLTSRVEPSEPAELAATGNLRGPQDRAGLPYLCMRDPAAFDLSKLSPGSGTAQGFTAAWQEAQSRTKIPGLVVVYSGTLTGPDLVIQAGSVRRLENGILVFMKTLPGSSVIRNGLELTNPYHVHSEHPGSMFVVAFGDTLTREGFVVSGITVDGTLDSMCHSLRHVEVSMTLPAANTKQRFGGVVLGEVLGAMTEDTDHDGKPDAWRVTLVGENLDAVMFNL